MGKLVKYLLYILIVVAAIVAIGFVLKNHKEEAEAQTAIVNEEVAYTAVRTAVASKSTPSSSLIANGNFAPSQELNFSAEKAGRIVNVLVKEGSYVKKGQTLATIRVEQYSVDLQNAEANYATAQAEVERFENAYKTGGVTKQQVDQVKQQLENAKARLETAKISVGDTYIKSSIDGIVNKKLIEPGSVVSAGTALFEIVNVSQLKLKVSVDENQVAGLSVGQKVKITASVFPDKTFEGKISFIAPKATESLNFPVEIIVTNNAGQQLKAGMYGTAHFGAPTTTPVLTVPRTAFVGSTQNGLVFVNENGIARQKKVLAGRIFGNEVEVLDGLTEGEQVIISGQINLTDGSKVQPIQ